MKVAIENFVISSDYRDAQEEIGELAHSIQASGLLQPLRVLDLEDGRYDVLAGRRRLMAMRDFMEVKELDVIQVELETFAFLVRNEHEACDTLVIQFEENYRRKDFKPLETAKLVKSIHDAHVAEHGKAIQGVKQGWSLDDTAELISKSKSFVSRLIAIASHPETVKDCTTLAEAMEAIDRMKKQKALKAIHKEKVKKGEKKTEGLNAESYLKNLFLDDALTFVSSLGPASVDLVYVDPPFGLEIDEIAGSVNYSAYEDHKHVIKDLVLKLVPEYRRVLKDRKYIVMWTSYELVPWLMDVFRTNDMHVGLVPLIWMKTNASGKTNNPNQELGSVAEVAVYAWKGDAELTIKGRGNVFPYEMVRKNRIHVAQKPENLIQDHLNIFSIPGDIVLDTFSGSGSTLRACFLAKRRFMGCEMKEEHFVNSILFTREWVKTLEVK